PSPNPPRVGYHHVDDAAIRRILNVPAGFDGNGVRVAMVDTGFFPHPYYSTRNLKFSPTPTTAAPRPQVDDYGHGTAVADNVFATAPKAELLGFQQTGPPQDALEDAAAAGVDIISCSWGWDREKVFPLVQASLLSIIAEVYIVLFHTFTAKDSIVWSASVNEEYSCPGSEPNVISIGGVYSDGQGALQVSNYASGY